MGLATYTASEPLATAALATSLEVLAGGGGLVAAGTGDVGANSFGCPRHPVKFPHARNGL